MPSHYVVRLWLTCNDNHPNAYAAFRTRFTPAVELAWSVLVYDGSISESVLRQKLDEKIQTDMQVHIENDLQTTIQKVKAFQNGEWSEGGGGLHEGHQVIYALPTASTSPKRWEFAYAGGGSNKPDMKAHAEWSLVESQP